MTTPTLTPKKRGRPRKVKETDSVATAPKKKRGRPPKTRPPEYEVYNKPSGPRVEKIPSLLTTYVLDMNATDAEGQWIEKPLLEVKRGDLFRMDSEKAPDLHFNGRDDGTSIYVAMSDANTLDGQHPEGHVKCAHVGEYPPLTSKRVNNWDRGAPAMDSLVASVSQARPSRSLHLARSIAHHLKEFTDRL